MQEDLLDLLVDEIRHLYSGERQQVRALPKLASAAQGAKLRDGLQNHLEDTVDQAVRLERAAQMCGVQVTGRTCKGMEGLIFEALEAIRDHRESIVLDLAVIAKVRRIKLYEVAGYMNTIQLARALGRRDVIALLSECLNEENAVEELLRWQMAIQAETIPEKEMTS